MCTYIVATLPENSDHRQVQLLADEHGLGWEQFSNRHLLAQVDPGSKLFFTSRKHCDCGTSLGSAARVGSTTIRNPRSRAANLRKRGWSEAKIARCLNDTTAAAERREQARAQVAGSTSPEIESWISFIRAAIASKATDCVGIVVHDYTRAIEGERVAITRLESTGVTDLSPTRLRTMENNVMYEFRCSTQQPPNNALQRTHSPVTPLAEKRKRRARRRAAERER